MDYKTKLLEWEKKRLEIYEKHTLHRLSYSKLAREYNLTASRIGAIIQQVKKKKAK